jgi:cell filamentation protein
MAPLRPQRARRLGWHEWAGEYRCARLLAMLMGLQAGLPALDFGGIRGAKKRRYIAAVHSAMDHNYATEIFREVIARTLKSAG